VALHRRPPDAELFPAAIFTHHRPLFVAVRSLGVAISSPQYRCCVIADASAHLTATHSSCCNATEVSSKVMHCSGQ
jgi:hypothetical protein